jgi:hypothetical protein
MANLLQPTGHEIATIEIVGWQVRVTSYRLGAEWICVADNVDPGATVARAKGESREAAIAEALRLAGDRLARTRIRS